MRLLILGVGSAFGADDIGWRAVEYLQQALPPVAGLDYRFHALAHPTQLHEWLADCDALIVIDGLLGVPMGTLHTLELDELKAAQTTSSHQLSVAESLALAEALGDLPERYSIIGVGVGSGDEPLGDAWRAPLLRCVEKFTDSPPATPFPTPSPSVRG